MKKFILLVSIMMVLSLTWAQELVPWQYIRHSSLLGSGDVQFRFNTTQPEYANTQFWKKSATGWAQADVTYLGDSVYEAFVPYTFGDNMRYRLRTQADVMGESAVTMHIAHLDSDAFPPSISDLAWIADDPEGDSAVENAPMLDLTATYMGLSSTKLHSVMQNVPGTFPQMNLINSFNLYMTMISNPEAAITDSVVYAMIYTFSIPGVISSGLYKLGIDPELNPVFERIGNIQSQVTGGKLYMACVMDDLINDPAFGAWPNTANSLFFTSLTMRINLDLSTMEPEFLFGDYSLPVVANFEDLVHYVTHNTLPELTNISVVQNVAGYLLSLDYYDADADFPIITNVVLNNLEEYEMQTPGLNFAMTLPYMVQLPTGWNTAYITFGDTDIENVTATAHPPTGLAEELLPIAELNCTMPNPLFAGGSGQRLNLSGLSKGHLKMDVFNLKGQKLGTILDAAVSDQLLVLPWNGIVNGTKLGSGVYFLKISQGTKALNKKFIVLR